MFDTFFEHLQQPAVIYRVIRDDSGSISGWLVERANSAAVAALDGMDNVDGRRLEEVIGPEAAAQTRPALEAVLTTGGHEEQTFQLDDRAFRALIFRLDDERVASTGVDVTQERRMELTVREREERYRLLFTNMTEAFALGDIVYDDEGRPSDFRFLEVNGAFWDQTGLTEEILERPAAEVLPEIEPEWLERYAHVALTGESLRVTDHNRDTGRIYSVFAYRPAPGRFALLFRDVTQEQETAAALQEKEALLRAIVNNAPAAIYAKDVDGRFILSNIHHSALLGKTLKEILGQTDESLHLTADNAQQYREHDRIVLQTNEPHEFDETAPDLEGGMAQYRSIKFPLRDADGRPYAVCGISTDVTEQRRVANELARLTADLERLVQERTEELRAKSQEAEKHLAQLEVTIRSMRDGLIVASPDGTILVMNQAFARFMGYRSVDDAPLFLHEVSQHFRADDEQGRVVQPGEGPLARALRGDSGLLELNLTPHDADAPPRIGRFSYAPVLDAQGAVDMVILTVSDITREKALEHRLEEIARFPQENPNPIIRVSREDELLQANPAARQWMDLWGIGIGDRVPGRLPQLLAEAREVDRQFDARLTIGNRPWQLNIIPVRDAHYANIYGRDISEQQVLEQQQETLRRQLVESQKLEAIGQLAGGVAHDFNNMMAVVLGWSSRLLKKTREHDPHRRGLEMIQQAGEKAAALTRQLLAFSRKQVLKPEVFDLRQVVGDMADMLPRLLSEEILLDVDMPERPVPIEADRNQLEQAVLNLAVNARDAMPRGGRLDLLLETTQDGSHADACLSGGPCAVLRIADTGHGMDEETLRHIFEPFFTTKPMGEGTGLGLSTVHGIVKQSGGHLMVDSELNRGTTFHIYLPLSDKQPAEQTVVAAEKDQPRQSGTILLVEDEKDVRELMALELREVGYEVLEAAMLEDAVQICRKHEGRLDLLLTDVVLPGGDGLQVAEAVRRDCPHAKVIFMSGYAEQQMRTRSTAFQNASFITKPFRFNALLDKIRALVP